MVWINLNHWIHLLRECVQIRLLRILTQEGHTQLKQLCFVKTKKNSSNYGKCVKKKNLVKNGKVIMWACRKRKYGFQILVFGRTNDCCIAIIPFLIPFVRCHSHSILWCFSLLILFQSCWIFKFPMSK